VQRTPLSLARSKKVPDWGLTPAPARQPLARRRQTSAKAGIVRGVLMKVSVYHAKAIRLTIPDSILVLADEVID
jgi:hypothetical protein